MSETRHGKVKESNTRTALTIDKDFYADCKAAAAKEGISFNTLVIKLLKEYMS